MNNTFCINWIGPFPNIEELKKWEKEYDQDGVFNFYIVTGIQKGKKKVTKYCGITERKYVYYRFDKSHKIHGFSKETKIWIGYLTDRNLIERKNLELCEKMIISYWQPEVNIKKKKYYPSCLVVLINRWFDTNQRLRKRNVHHAQKLSDVIIYDYEHRGIYGAEHLKTLATIE